MRNSGNDSPEVFTRIAEEEVWAKRSPTDHRTAALTTRRLRNGLEALATLPYYLFVCPITQPRRMARFLENLFEYQRAEKVHSGNQRLIPTVDPEQLFPGLFHQKVSLLDLGSRPGGTTFFETYLMACLIKSLNARTIFEFGTFEGRTTLQLASNSPDDATIYTLDLPENVSSTRFERLFPNEAGFRSLPVGGLFHSQVESRKIKQLLQDSAVVDYTPLHAKVDFIFVDGDHGKEYVKSDSESAFSMISQDGVVIWHDYGSRWKDVAIYLHELAGKRRLYHLRGTSLVIYRHSL
jgi:hypothetical protein